MSKQLMAIVALLALAGIGFFYYETQKETGEVPGQVVPVQNQNAQGQTASSTQQAATSTIATFEECVSAGYPVAGGNPRQCSTSDMIFFEIETCKAPTGESMTFPEAESAFANSPCAIEGSMKENKDHFCNENTGTWWIDILTYKPGCNPACVVDVKTQQAEINWRCTGATPQQ